MYKVYDEFVDSYGQTVRIQESSNILGGCWIFCEKDGKDVVEHLGKFQAFSPHLSAKQAEKVARALLAYARHTRKK